MFSTLLSRSQQQLQGRADCMTRRQITSAQKRALQRKQKQQQANETNNNATTTSSSKQPPTTQQVMHKNITKAPHMQKQVFESTSAGKTKVDGLFDKISANPLVFAIFIFPTVMMGVALIVRPDFRAQILGGGDDDKKNKSRTNATISVPENAPVPLYESAASSSSAISAIEEAEEQSKGESVTLEIDGESDDIDIVTNEKTEDLIYLMGIRPHPSLR